METKKYLSLDRLTEYNDLIKQYIKEFIEESVNEKADLEHEHNDLYYTIEQIDAMEFITTDEIDEICGGVTEESIPQSDIDELMAELR